MADKSFSIISSTTRLPPKKRMRIKEPQQNHRTDPNDGHNHDPHTQPPVTAAVRGNASTIECINLQQQVNVATDHNTESQQKTVASNKVFTVDDLLTNIFQFVGPHQYLWVASTNRQFRRMYKKLYDGATLTQCNMSTIQHAELCVRAGGPIPQNHCLPLWNMALRHGWLRGLYHLRYVYSFSDPSLESYLIAVDHGYLQILQWLVSVNGTTCLNNEVACSMAARNGHIHILHFIYQSTIPSSRPWNQNTCYSAASRGQWLTLQWLLEHGCPWCERTIYIIQQALYYLHLSISQTT